MHFDFVCRLATGFVLVLCALSSSRVQASDSAAGPGVGTLIATTSSLPLDTYVIEAVLDATDRPVLLVADDATTSSPARLLRARFSPLTPDHLELDPTFAIATFDGTPRALLLQADGSIWVAGDFHQVNGQPRPTLARFSPDGTLSPDFAPSLPSPSDTVNARVLATGAEGDVYVGYAGGGGLQRYRTDGTLDASFQADALGDAPENAVTAVIEAADGKVFIAERTPSPFGTLAEPDAQYHRIIRVGHDGSIDPTFAGKSPDGTVTCFDLLPDGRLVVGGDFETLQRWPYVPSTAPRHLAGLELLLPNGDFDPDFGRFGGIGDILTVLYRDGRILAAGGFRSGIARVNLDGSYDPSFMTGYRANGEFGPAPRGFVSSASYTSGGDLFLAGEIVTFNTTPRTDLAYVTGDTDIGAIAPIPASTVALESAGSVTLTLRRYGPVAQAASILCSTASASSPALPAIAGSDFTATSIRVHWAADDVADKTVAIPLLDDTLLEANEQFRVILSEPEGPVAPAGSATIELLDNDTPVSFDFMGHPSFPLGTAMEGGSLTLNVSVSSPSPVSYQWFRNGAKIHEATSATYSKSGLSFFDSGLYTVAVTNAAGTVVSNPAQVVVRPTATLPDPSIIYHPTATEANPGETIRLHVGAVGTGAGVSFGGSGLVYRWFKDDAPITNGGRISGATSPVLTIEAVQASDAGAYRVTVTGGGANLVSITSQPASLDVLGAPVIESAYFPLDVIHGSYALQSLPVKAARPATYVWTRNGEPLPQDERYARTQNSSLWIDDFREDYAGDYTLTVTNAFGTASSAPVKVRFKLTPQSILHELLSDQTYGTASVLFAPTSSSDLPVTVKVVSGPAAYANGQLAFHGVGPVKLRVSQAGNSIYAPAEPLEFNFTIYPAETVGVSLAASEYWFTGKSPRLDIVTTPPGLHVDIFYTTIVAESPGSPLPPGGEIFSDAIQPGHYTAYVSVNDPRAASNTTESFSFTILPPIHKQSLAFPQPAAVAYGDEPVTLVASTSSGLPVEFDVPSSTPSGIATISGDKLTLLGAGQVKVRARQLGGDGFGATAAITRTITVNKAPLAVSFEPASRLVREPNPVFTPRYRLTDFVNGDTAADLAATRPVGVTKATASSPAGVYAITHRGGLDANYHFVAGAPAFLTVLGFSGAFEALLVDGSGTARGKLELLVSNNALTYTGTINLASEPAFLSIRGDLTATDGNSATGVWNRPANPAKSITAIDLGFEIAGATLDGELSINGAPALSIASGSRVFVQGLSGKTKLPSPWTGAHTLVLRDPAPISESDTRALPLGAGHAAVTVAATGVMTFKGTLADGATLTGAARPAFVPADSADDTGRFRVFLRPYAKRTQSFVSGDLDLVRHPDQIRFPGRHRVSELDGRLFWAKAGADADKSYRHGFETVLVAVVDPWLAPNARVSTMNGASIPAATLVQRLGLGDSSSSTATVAVSYSLPEGLDFGARADFLPTSLNLSAKGVLTVSPPLPEKASNPAFSLTVTPGSGAFKGSFTLSDVPAGTTKPVLRKAAFSGTLRQGPDGSADTLGHGHVLFDPIPGDTGPASDEKISAELILSSPSVAE